MLILFRSLRLRFAIQLFALNTRTMLTHYTSAIGFASAFFLLKAFLYFYLFEGFYQVAFADVVVALD